ncbi:MAG: helix-turn-helix transcriptional regulator [Rhodoplanes sp.]|jgi:XRE family transcriptional regulator, aerobic/anaerobic benzoate catabolism transcriptional regulator
MAGARPRSQRRETGQPESARSAGGFAAEIGRMVRLGRAKRGISRRQLAADSGISERYLAQIEGGHGNPSVNVLKSIADAIAVPVFELLPRTGLGNSAIDRVHDLLARLPATELPAIAAAMEERLGSAADRGRRIALVGLRGAGKSTLGRKLAEHLGVPFLELNRVIEQNHGASVAVLIELSGLATFRKYEHECLQRVIAGHDAAVIATAGGIVANPQTYELLLRRTHAIWIKARPEEHMARVIAQGDFRPMAHNREAMGDLVAILDARSADYSRAESQLDTSGCSVEQSLADLVQLVAPYARAP